MFKKVKKNIEIVTKPVFIEYFVNDEKRFMVIKVSEKEEKTIDFFVKKTNE